MIFLIIVLFLFFYFIVCFKNNKWASILVLLHLVSILAGQLLDYRMDDSILGLGYAILTCVYLYLIIAPWANFKSISAIENDYGDSIESYARIVLFMGVFATLFFTPVVLVLNSLDLDPNNFKYGGGMDDFFKSSAFPIPFKIFILITFFANISLIALPLHFYYMIKGKKLMSILAFIASIAYVMRGLTYFSRAVTLQYVMLYGMLFLLFYKQIDKRILKYLKVVVFAGVVMVVINFFAITHERFDDGYSLNQTEYAIDKMKYFDDPAVVSLLDYLSQGYYNSHDLLMKYDGYTFSGQTTFNEILVLMNQYLGFPFSSDDYQNLREKLWPGQWSKTFNGYVAYVVYDFGIIGSLLVTLLYFGFIKRSFRTSKKSTIKLSKLTWLTLFLQVPLYSIFYSAYGGIVIPGIFFFVINYMFVKHQSLKRKPLPTVSIESEKLA